MVSFGTITTILSFALPYLLPRIIALYRSFRNPSPRVPIRPLPRRAAIALNLLLICGVLAFLSTLPIPPFTPPANIFAETASRLQTPTNVLFTRLRSLRPLTPLDEALEPKLRSLDARRAYLTYGPHILAHCPFCASDAPASYALYALPRLLAPHALHLAVLGLATSAPIAGPDAARWRALATAAALALATADAVLVCGRELGVPGLRATTTTTPTAELPGARGPPPLFWRARILRGVAVAAVDAALGWAVWAAATRRLWVRPASAPERLEGVTRGVEALGARVNAVGGVRNAVARDRGLRARSDRHWAEEGRVMAEVVEEREVREGLERVMARMDAGKMEEQAGRYADGVFQGIDGLGGGEGRMNGGE